MNDTLIVYFSRSGTTERLARELGQRLGANLEPIRPVRPYAGPGGWVSGVWQAVRGEAPAIGPARSPMSYGLLVVGGPVWAGRLAPPMRSYLRGLGGRGGAVAAFWVSASGGAYPTVGAEIERLTGKRLVASAAFSQREVVRGEAGHRLDMFAAMLKSPARRAA